MYSPDITSLESFLGELVDLDEMISHLTEPLVEIVILGAVTTILTETENLVLSLHPRQPPVTNNVVFPLVDVLKLQELALAAPQSVDGLHSVGHVAVRNILTHRAVGFDSGVLLWLEIQIIHLDLLHFDLLIWCHN